MTDLIARIEAATGPSRELDAEIARATGWQQQSDPRWGIAAPHWYKDGKAFHELAGSHWYSQGVILPPFTASVDAALSLVGNRLVSMETYDDSGVYPEHVRASAWVQGAPRYFAATAALAIAAAALRAMETDRG